MIGKLLGSMGITQYIVTGLVFIIISMVGLSYLYYKDSQKIIKILNKNISTLELDNELVKGRLNKQQEAIDNAISRQNDNVDKMADLNGKIRTISEGSRELSKLYADHDLNRLIVAKPNLMENKINEATKNIFNEFESITD